MIRSSKHTTKLSNKGKLDNLNIFINEYRRVAAIIVNEIYSYGYKWFYNNELHEFNIKKNLLELPKYIEYKNFSIETFLTARTLSSLCTQLTGVLKASVEKQRKRIYILEKMKANTSKRERKLLAKKLKQNIPQKPNVENLNPELSSNCCKFIESDKHFNGFIKLSAIVKDKTNILIPIKYTKHSNSFLNNNFERMNSFLISETFIDIRWKNEKSRIVLEI